MLLLKSPCYPPLIKRGGIIYIQIFSILTESKGLSMVFISDPNFAPQTGVLNTKNTEMVFGMLIFYNRLFLKRPYCFPWIYIVKKG